MIDLQNKLALTPRECAAVIGCGKSTVYDLIKRGELPCLTIGGRHFVRVVTLQAWLEEREQERRQIDRVPLALGQYTRPRRT